MISPAFAKSFGINFYQEKRNWHSDSRSSNRKGNFTAFFERKTFAFSDYV